MMTILHSPPNLTVGSRAVPHDGSRAAPRAPLPYRRGPADREFSQWFLGIDIGEKNHTAGRLEGKPPNVK